MSQMLESCDRERFTKAVVSLLKIIGSDAQELLDHTIAHKLLMPHIYHRQLVDWALDVHILTVGAAAAAHFNGFTTLGELSEWLKKLPKKYSDFKKAAVCVHGAANIQVAEEMEWSENELADLAKEVEGQVQFTGDDGTGPVKDRIRTHVSSWLDKLFDVKT